MFKFIAALAQPLKTLYIAFLLVFAVTFLTVLVGNLSGGSPVPAQWLSSVAYARCFGGFAAVVGGGFIVAALTESRIFS